MAAAGELGQPRGRFLTKCHTDRSAAAFGVGSVTAAAADAVRAQEWWLAGLNVTQAWPRTRGSGVIVAVLGTGVAASHPDLAGDVLTGPDYSGSGRTPSGPFWGIDGTQVAAIIAGHGHGPARQSGIVGLAPAVPAAWGARPPRKSLPAGGTGNATSRATRTRPVPGGVPAPSPTASRTR